MVKFNAVEKKCNMAVMLLNEAKDLNKSKSAEDANRIKKECANQTNEINNMMNALKEALEYLAVAWNKANEHVK